MEERKACALLKQRFEAAGFHIEENRPFDEDGIRFEIDGFDPGARVGYEYISSEAGDGWDVDGSVIAALEARRQKGELDILLVDEADAARLGELADAFLAELAANPPQRLATAKVVAAAKPTPEPTAAKPGPAAKPKPEPSAAKAKAKAEPAKPKAKPEAKPKPKAKKPAKK